MPTNTENSTKWATNNFEALAEQRTKSCPDDSVPDLLKSHEAGLVCKWQCRYVLETRKDDGTPYPPSTLQCLLSGLNRELQKNQAPFSILDQANVQF